MQVGPQCTEKAPCMAGCYDNVDVMSDNIWNYYSTCIYL